MITKDTEKKNNLEFWLCECFVFVLTFVFGLVWFGFLVVSCTEQGAVWVVHGHFCRRLDTI